MNKSINETLDETKRYEATFWVQVLEPLIDITLTLEKNILAYRGHYIEHGENCLSLIQLLAKYDIVVHGVVSIPNRHTKYLGHDIQN